MRGPIQITTVFEIIQYIATLTKTKTVRGKWKQKIVSRIGFGNPGTRHVVGNAWLLTQIIYVSIFEISVQYDTH